MYEGKYVVHLRAPVQTLSGYGVHSRQIIDYLLGDDRFIVCLESINWGDTPFIHNDDRLAKYYEARIRFEEAKKVNLEFDFSVHVTIPNEFHRTAKFNIGVTAGIETDRCTPAWISKCEEMDMIVVPSKFSEMVLSKTVAQWKNKNTGEMGEFRITKPIVVIPEWFERPDLKSTKITDLKFESKCNFLHVGQWGSKGGFGEDRKNIADLVKFFYEAFKEESGVGLVLKINVVNNSEQDFQECQRRLKEIKTGFPKAKCRVHLIHESLTDEEMWSLYRHPQISSFVSLTHGEGFGLPLLEAAAAGLPVIATGWSGHLDFLDASPAFSAVPFSMVDVPECQIWSQIIEKGHRWASPDAASAKKIMKKTASSPSFMKKKAEAYVPTIDSKFSKQSVVSLWRNFFDKLLGVEDAKTNIQSKNDQEQMVIPGSREDKIRKLRALIRPTGKKTVLYVMPRSAGDVLISTAIADSLIKNRHYPEECDFYFATSKLYLELLEEIPNIIPLEFKEDMLISDITYEVFDYVYSPGVNLQYIFSNWLLGNGEYSVRLLEEVAKHCNLSPRDITDYAVVPKECDLPVGPFVTIGTGGIKDAKDYCYWDEVIHNIKLMIPGVKVVQLGFLSEELKSGVIDKRGITFRECLYLQKHAIMHIGVDTFNGHSAAAVGIPHLIICGSTNASSVAPVSLKRGRPLQIMIESTNRNGCKNPCYKDSCSNVIDGKNCLSNISPEAVCNGIFELLKKIEQKQIQEETQQQVF